MRFQYIDNRAPNGWDFPDDCQRILKKAKKVMEISFHYASSFPEPGISSKTVRIPSEEIWDALAAHGVVMFSESPASVRLSVDVKIVGDIFPESEEDWREVAEAALLNEKSREIFLPPYRDGHWASRKLPEARACADERNSKIRA